MRVLTLPDPGRYCRAALADDRSDTGPSLGGRGRFQSRGAIVTGAGRGIGARIAERLATEGASVAAADLHEAGAERTVRRIREGGGTAEPFRLDVSSVGELDRMVGEVEDALGSATLGVAAAGVIRVNPLLDLPEEAWDATFSVNAKGTFFLLQSMARRMATERPPGAFVAIASIAGRGGRPLYADYAASKAAVISVVRSAALALAPFGIRVNCVCPGIVDTPMTRLIHRDRAELSGVPAEESLDEGVRTIPLGRIETPDDVAGAVLFLLSEDAGYVTGQALNVCGGMELD